MLELENEDIIIIVLDTAKKLTKDIGMKTQNTFQ